MQKCTLPSRLAVIPSRKQDQTPTKYLVGYSFQKCGIVFSPNLAQPGGIVCHCGHHLELKFPLPFLSSMH
jgi:hypothetical protein